MQTKKGSGKNLINGDIQAQSVRLIDEGINEIMSVEKALAKAREAGLDLVEIVPDADPPVCKIFDYSRYRYQAQKKSVEKTKHRTASLKEVKFRPNIGDHDYDVKLRNIIAFLKRGDKVKATLRFMGREMLHQDVGMRVMTRLIDDTQDCAKIEVHPKSEGNLLIMVMAPKAQH